MTNTPVVLELALTIRHDGQGGVADDLAEPEGLRRWIEDHGQALGALPCPADAQLLAAVRELRAAVRSLFARAVRPGPPSPADAPRLLPAAEALRRLNAAALRVPAVPTLAWPDGGPPQLCHTPEPPDPEPAQALLAALARDAMSFLCSPQREQLRACQAPRCVRYFLKEHPRQEWCKPSCGNRARVARHHQRHR